MPQLGKPPFCWRRNADEWSTSSESCTVGICKRRKRQKMFNCLSDQTLQATPLCGLHFPRQGFAYSCSLAVTCPGLLSCKPLVKEVRGDKSHQLLLLMKHHQDCRNTRSALWPRMWYPFLGHRRFRPPQGSAAATLLLDNQSGCRPSTHNPLHGAR